MAISSRIKESFIWKITRLFGYFVLFLLLCIPNHFVSVILFNVCGRCLWTYLLVYTTCLIVMSTVLSTIIFQIFIGKDDRGALLRDLKKVRYEDMPFIMVKLLEKENERKADSKYSTLLEKAQIQEPGEDDRVCVACLDLKPSIVNRPCGHNALCSRCNWHLLRVSLETRSPLACSLCRSPIRDFDGDMRPNLELIEWSDVKEALEALRDFHRRRKSLTKSPGF